MCDCVALSQVQLLEYVERLKDLAAISPSALAFDEKSVNELLLNTPRIVQEALLEEARHCGLTHVKYPARCECLGMSALIRNPSAMLQGNLRRMKACHEADRGLDARRVVPAVWMSRVCRVPHQAFDLSFVFNLSRANLPAPPNREINR